MVGTAGTREAPPRPTIDLSDQLALLIRGTQNSTQEEEAFDEDPPAAPSPPGPVLLLVSVVSLGGVAGASLPPQASDQGVAHAHTHGPDSLALDPRGRAPGADAAKRGRPCPLGTCQYDRAALTADAEDLNTLPAGARHLCLPD